MILKLFSQFDFRGPPRLVWEEKPPEGQAGTPAKAAPELPKTPDELAAEAAAAATRQAEAGARVQKAAKAGQPNPAEAERELDALDDTAKGAGGASRSTAAKPPESREAAEEFTDIKSFFKRIIDTAKKNIKKTELRELTQECDRILNNSPQEKEKAEAYLSEHMWKITRQDEENFHKKFFKDGSWDLESIGRSFMNAGLTNEEFTILLGLPGASETMFPMGKEFRTKNKERLEAKRKIEDFAALVAKPQYKDAYEAFRKEPTDENKQKFLALFTEESEDRKLAEWGLTAAPSEAEKYYVRTKVLKGKKLTEEEIDEKIKNGTLGLREGNAALAILEGGEAEEDAAEAADTLQGLGWFAGFEKFFEQLMAWLEKFTQGLEKKVTGWEAKAAAKERFSPLGEGKKITAQGPYEGKGIAFQVPKDSELMAIRGPGKVSQIDDGVAITLADKSRVEYHGVTIKEGAEGTTIKGGESLAKITEAGLVHIQTFGPDEKETDPTKEIARFISNS